MKQHFVPRIYLKHFSERIQDDYFVDVFDKNLERHFNTNIKMICAEKDLYTLKKDNKVAKDILAIEKMYSNFIEPIYLKSYNILINDTITRITHEQRSEIIIGIFQLYMRNPKLLRKSILHHKSELNNKIAIAKSENKKGITFFEEDFSFKEYTENDILKFVTEHLTNSFKEHHIIATQKICEYHENIKIEVSKIIDDAEFITSDNPLATEDFVTKDDNPFLHSKEFLIPLNKKYALRLFHETSKELNVIHRKSIHNGTAELFNDNINKETSRFLIGTKKAFEQHFEIAKILNDTSIERKMAMIKDVLEKAEVTPENSEMWKVMKIYLDKFEREGTLSKPDEYNFYMQLRQLNITWKKKSIQ